MDFVHVTRVPVERENRYSALAADIASWQNKQKYMDFGIEVIFERPKAKYNFIIFKQTYKLRFKPHANNNYCINKYYIFLNIILCIYYVTMYLMLRLDMVFIYNLCIIFILKCVVV